MRKTFLPFARPCLDEADIEAVADVLRSGWLTTGPKVAEFETRFGAYTGSSSSVAVCSATAGLHLVLKALDIGPGDEVITPSLTWVSTVNLIVLCGATPVFVDVDRDTLMVTTEAIEEKITPKTRLIIPVHFAGSAVDIEPMREMAAARSIHLVEDAAHSAGTTYKGRPIGSVGTSIFSFHAIKNLTTGEGGMLCTDQPELAARVRRLRFHGLGVDAFERKSHGRQAQAEVLEPGYKYNMTDLTAVIGLRQLARLDDLNDKRRDLAMYYRWRLFEIPELLPLADPSYPVGNCWHLMIVRLDTPRLKRAAFMEALKSLNIGTGIHFKAVHLQKYYRETLSPPEGSLPNSEWNSHRLLSLPLFPTMVQTDVDDVIDAIKECLIK